MPLLYKGKRVDLDEKENPVVKELFRLKNELIKTYFEFPMVMKYVPEYFQPDTQNIGKIKKPVSIPIPLTATVFSKEGSGEWQYFETTRFNAEHDKDEYLPKNLTNFTGTFIIPEEKWELAVFLRFFSPYCKDNDQKKRKHFTFENAVLEARKKVSERRMKNEVETILIGERSPLTDAEVRKIASFYKINSKFKASIDEIRLNILTRVELNEQRSPGKGYSDFLKDYKLDEITLAKANVQELIQQHLVVVEDVVNSGGARVIRLPLTEQQKLDGKKKGIEICKVSKTAEANDVLYDYLMKHDQERLDLFKALETK